MSSIEFVVFSVLVDYIQDFIALFKLMASWGTGNKFRSQNFKNVLWTISELKATTNISLLRKNLSSKFNLTFGTKSSFIENISNLGNFNFYRYSSFFFSMNFFRLKFWSKVKFFPHWNIFKYFVRVVRILVQYCVNNLKIVNFFDRHQSRANPRGISLVKSLISISVVFSIFWNIQYIWVMTRPSVKLEQNLFFDASNIWYALMNRTTLQSKQKQLILSPRKIFDFFFFFE